MQCYADYESAADMVEEWYSGIMMADTDGYFVGKLSGNTLSYCYIQAGARQPGDKPAVVTCNEVRKK